MANPPGCVASSGDYGPATPTAAGAASGRRDVDRAAALAAEVVAGPRARVDVALKTLAVTADGRDIAAALGSLQRTENVHRPPFLLGIEHRKDSIFRKFVK